MTDGIEKLGLKLGRQTNEAGLDPIPRTLGRKALEPMPSFYGYDLWNAWEVSYLLPAGKPVVFHMQATYGSDTPFMIESKSFKLYLNSFNNREFEDHRAFADLVRDELSQCVGGPVSISFYQPQQSPDVIALPGLNLDQQPYKGTKEETRINILRGTDNSGAFAFHSHLLRSNCPVTNQPDWGSVIIEGKGPNKPEAEALLAYIISYRNHQGFHESCCEMIFTDLYQKFEPETLDVRCCYTRRGGLDINPCRSTRAGIRTLRAPVWRQ